jgi:hypothetical protein
VQTGGDAAAEATVYSRGPHVLNKRGRGQDVQASMREHDWSLAAGPHAVSGGHEEEVGGHLTEVALRRPHCGAEELRRLLLQG